jgi:hypothetical protein
MGRGRRPLPSSFKNQTITTTTKKKRYKMKKIVALVAVLFSVVIPINANASTAGSVVIIDSNFNESLISGSREVVCLYTTNCSVPQSGKTTQSMHGTIMAEVARTANPTANLILIKAATTPAGIVNGDDFNNALSWVIANLSTKNIKSVSFARGAGSNTLLGCLPTTGKNKAVVKASTIANVDSLKGYGVNVYASTGNTNKVGSLEYPACLSNVTAVTTLSRQKTDGVNEYTDIILSAGSLKVVSKSGVSTNQVFMTTSATATLAAAMYDKISFVPNSRTRVLLP